MKICFLEGDMSRRGGTERMTAIIANELCKDNEVWIISLRLADDDIYYQLNNKIVHHVLRPAAGYTGIIKQIKEIHDFIKMKKIDSVINVDTGMGYYGIMASKGTKAKVITWEHSNYFNNWNSRVFKYIRIFAAKYSDAMIVLTEQDKKNYESNIRSKKTVYVIPNPIERHEFKYDVDSKIILSAGLLLPIKGYDKAIRVAEKVLPQYPGWKWIICGEGPERERLQKMIDEAGISEQMLLVGNVKNMDEKYQKAAMFVMTSEMEGLPMVLLEAKSWGIPMISFDIMTGPRDVIDDEKNGYLIVDYSIEDMAFKIESLINNQELREKFSVNTQEGIEKLELSCILSRWKKVLGHEEKESAFSARSI